MNNRYYYKENTIIGDNHFLVIDRCRKGLEKLGEMVIATTGTLMDAQIITSLLNSNTCAVCPDEYRAFI
jgi:hypothetical protein